jgi:dipeptidyl aminopeptidase/acylaminoacyl peptidase
LTRKITLPITFALFVFGAQPADKFALTVDNIMRGPALAGYEPAQIRWSHDSLQVYFQWKRAGDKESEPLDTYVAGRDGAGRRKLTEDEAKQAPPPSGDTSRDKKLTVFTRDGDLFVYDNRTGQIRQVTKTSDAETNPRFLPDGKRIAFTRGGNLYVISLDDGFLEQMTDIRPAAATGTPTPAVGGRGGGGRGGRGGETAPVAAGGASQAAASASQEYLKKEEKEFFETVRDRATLHDEEEARRKQHPARKPFNIEARQSVTGLQLSPDGKYVLASVSESGNAKNTTIPQWITDTAYVEDETGRSNVGDSANRSRLAILDAVTGEVKWADHGPAVSEVQREVDLLQPVWSEDGTRCAVEARAADNKDRWLLALDPATGKTSVLDREHDDAWVAGGGGGGFGAAAFGWMKNDRELWFRSERTGYAQLYAVAYDGGEPRALTSGKWEVLAVRQSKDKSHFYLTASKDSPYENHLYEMSGDGSELTRLTKAPGKHTTTVSPDEHWIADIYSYSNQPPDLFVQENKPLAEPRRLTTSPTPEFLSYPWLDVPIVTFTARDGVKVPARLFKPASAKRGGPGVVFVHGAGYLQNVDRWWSSGYYREYMFDHLLMERGFTIIDVDYRGSAGYGRDWRTAVYEHMGVKDLDDIVDAAKYLAAEQGVDPRKIGLFGGSYGGFITLMAMFTQPDVFAAGAALRPVSDWALYNHGYTANILNTPQADGEAYRRSSPIFFADGLKGALLICHGMVDNNVEFTDTVRLVERLIELRKENWQLAVYPVESHGFIQPTSWADEYKRILALFEKNLK